MPKIFAKALACSFAVFGFAYLLSGLQTPIKAELSKILIEQAWNKTLQGDHQSRPWPWMDSTPVAKLYIPKYGASHVVMSGVSGAIMAFAPGWHEGTNRPGQPGVSLISAHKDMHFSYLKNMQFGDRFELITPDGRHISYEVEDMKILDRPTLNVQNDGHDSIVVLSTCYPFANWQIGGDMRFVVIGREVPENNKMQLAEL